MSTKGTHIPDWLQVPFAGITPAPSQKKGQDLFPTGNWRSIRPVYRDKMPPCNNACGTNEKIQGYLDLVKRGKYLDISVGPERGAYAEDTARLIDAEVKRIMGDAHNEARRILSDHRDVLESVTRRLLEREVMEGDELRILMNLPPTAATSSLESETQQTP